MVIKTKYKEWPAQANDRKTNHSFVRHRVRPSTVQYLSHRIECTAIYNHSCNDKTPSQLGRFQVIWVRNVPPYGHSAVRLGRILHVFSHEVGFVMIVSAFGMQNLMCSKSLGSVAITRTGVVRTAYSRHSPSNWLLYKIVAPSAGRAIMSAGAAFTSALRFIIK